MSATVIIPQHGRADLTLACITSIRRHESHPWPILVIDDGSPDKSAQQLTQLLHLQSDHAQLAAPSTKLAGSQCLPNGVSHSSHITVLHQPHRGLTAAWNTAALHATTPILVFLNNDTIASGPFLQSLILPLQEPHRPPTHPGCGSEQPGCRINRLAKSPAMTYPLHLLHPLRAQPSPACDSAPNRPSRSHSLSSSPRGNSSKAGASPCAVTISSASAASTSQ
ncbi:MAG: glycosyltransferase family 2 protein [Planctomycetaceae bacterium]|nr:glycosyltransferase family 2 protein [Planctomycetaceae bacterium]